MNNAVKICNTSVLVWTHFSFSWLLRVLQKKEYIYIYWLTRLWRQESPKPVGWVGKLETQRIAALQFKVKGHQAGDPGKIQCCSSSLKAVCWQNSFLLKEHQSLFYWGLWLIGWGPPIYRGQFALLRAHWYTCYLMQKYTLRKIQNNIWPNTWTMAQLQ